MGARKRSKKGGRSRRRAARLPAAAAEATLSRLDGGGSSSSGPSSFVIRRGRLTSAARQLVRDMRRVMLPHCSERLRERRSSKLRDYLAAASLLGVSHLQLFTQTDAGLYFKLVQLPAGPTLSFRVLRFSLVHDVQRYQQQKKKNARAPDSRDFLHPPLLILSPHVAAANKKESLHAAGGAAAAAQDKAAAVQMEKKDVDALVARVVKSAFPPIDIRTVALRDCRRVVLFRRESAAASSPSAAAASSAATGEKPSFRYQLRQYAVVRRIARDGGQAITPGVRALVEAGGSRVAADRLLQQRFGLSLAPQKGGGGASADHRRGGDVLFLPGSSSSSSGREVPAAAASEGAAKAQAMWGGGLPEAAGGRSAAAGSSSSNETMRRRKAGGGEGGPQQQRREEEDDVGQVVKKYGESSSSSAGPKRRTWRDICEATLAREHASASAETDDEEGLSFDVAEVGAEDSVGRAPGAATCRRNREGLLLLSVAAAAQHREKKDSASRGVTEAAAAHEDPVLRALASENDVREEEEEEKEAAATGVAAAAGVAAGGGAAAAEEEEERAASVDGEEDVNKQKDDKVKMSVSLVELGPRMHLELVKVEEDVCTGAVIFHNFVKKSTKEVLELQQRENVLRKQREKEREAVQKALDQKLKKRKRGKDMSDSSHSGAETADDVSGDGSPTDEESEGTEKMTTLESELLQGPSRGKHSRGTGPVSTDLRPKGNVEADESSERASVKRFRSESRGVPVTCCATTPPPADDQKSDSGKVNANAKPKGGNTSKAESRNRRRDASAVLRRYEEVTARQRKGVMA